MTPEERFERIEQRHLALTESLEMLTTDIRAMQKERQQIQAEQQRLDARERRAREALLTGIAAYLRALKDDEAH